MSTKITRPATQMPKTQSRKKVSVPALSRFHLPDRLSWLRVIFLGVALILLVGGGMTSILLFPERAPQTWAIIGPFIGSTLIGLRCGTGR